MMTFNKNIEIQLNPIRNYSKKFFFLSSRLIFYNVKRNNL